MAKFVKHMSTGGGAWVKASELKSGTKAKLVSEALPVEGQYGLQTVAKIRIQGNEEALNINLNKATVNALVDAFGDESKEWCNQVLTIQTEKMVVSGKRITAVYLIPQGYFLGEDEGGYLVITKEETAPVTPKKTVSRKVELETDEDTREVPDEAYDDGNW